MKLLGSKEEWNQKGKSKYKQTTFVHMKERTHIGHTHVRSDKITKIINGKREIK